MPLDPQCKKFLDGLAAMGGPPLHELTPLEARGMVLPAELGGPEQPLHSVEDRAVPGPSGLIPLRVYTPAPGSARPALIYFHGGGYLLGNLDLSDRQCREIAHLAGCVVVSVDYRLAPEHKFPAAVDDAYAATSYVAGHAHEFGIDAGSIAVGGESSGGNLAAVTALKARERGAPKLIFQLLVYPHVDFDDDSASMREFCDGHFLTRDAIEYFARHYFADRRDGRQPLASPLLADSLEGLPPAFVLTAECDPLRDQGEAYAARLELAGVRVQLKRYDGMIHPFFSLGGIIDSGRAAVADAASALRQAFSVEV